MSAQSVISARLANADVYNRPLDEITQLYMGKTTGGSSAPVRYAVRQVLDQEIRKETLRKRAHGKQARYAQGAAIGPAHAILDDNNDDKENNGNRNITKDKTINSSRAPTSGERDFFGRLINEARPLDGKLSQTKDFSQMGNLCASSTSNSADGNKAWVSFHEGYSNAVRKPMTLREIMGSFR